MKIQGQFTYLKAIVGGLAAGLATLSSLWNADGSLSWQDGLSALVAALGAGGVVAWAKNKTAVQSTR